MDSVSGSPAPMGPLISQAPPFIPLQAAPSPAQPTSKQESLFPANCLVEGDPHLSYLLLIPNSQDM